MTLRIATGFLALSLASGCVRGPEAVVRSRASTDFACAEYALRVEEVGPDVFRATGCGQELIYACQEQAVKRPPVADGDDFGDREGDTRVVCNRRLR